MDGAYRLYLQDLLRKNGIDFDFVGITQSHTASVTPSGYKSDSDHTSFSGFRIHEVHNTLKNALIINPDTLEQPDIALIMLGTNDMIADVGLHGPPPYADHKAFEDASRNYEELLNYLFEHYSGLTVLVGNLLTTGNALDTDSKEQIIGLRKIQKRIKYFNRTFVDKLKSNENIRLNGGNLDVIDMFSLFQPSELPSRFHPAVDDYETVAQSWFETMLNLDKY